MSFFGTKSTTNYGMFSEAGNERVNTLVQYALNYDLDWSAVLEGLRDLSNIEGFGEAMDTEVRECVYIALGKTSDFYV